MIEGSSKQGSFPRMTTRRGASRTGEHYNAGRRASGGFEHEVHVDGTIGKHDATVVRAVE